MVNIDSTRSQQQMKFTLWTTTTTTSQPQQQQQIDSLFDPLFYPLFDLLLDPLFEQYLIQNILEAHSNSCQNMMGWSKLFLGTRVWRASKQDAEMQRIHTSEVAVLTVDLGATPTLK